MIWRYSALAWKHRKCYRNCAKVWNKRNELPYSPATHAEYPADDPDHPGTRFGQYGCIDALVSYLVACIIR
nr:hemSTUV operon protein 70 - Yersinia enterocolitica [Yersinia enterocolitica]